MPAHPLQRLVMPLANSQAVISLMAHAKQILVTTAPKARTYQRACVTTADLQLSEVLTDELTVPAGGVACFVHGKHACQACNIQVCKHFELADGLPLWQRLSDLVSGHRPATARGTGSADKNASTEPARGGTG